MAEPPLSRQELARMESHPNFDDHSRLIAEVRRLTADNTAANFYHANNCDAERATLRRVAEELAEALKMFPGLVDIQALHPYTVDEHMRRIEHWVMQFRDTALAIAASTLLASVAEIISDPAKPHNYLSTACQEGYSEI